MEPGNHDVLVVARVAEKRGVRAVAVADSRHILVYSASPDLECRTYGPVRVGHIEVGAYGRAAPEHRVQIKCRSSGVGRGQRIGGQAERRGLVEGDVVVGELADERGSGSHRGIVR